MRNNQSLWQLFNSNARPFAVQEPPSAFCEGSLIDEQTTKKRDDHNCGQWGKGDHRLHIPLEAYEHREIAACQMVDAVALPAVLGRARLPAREIRIGPGSKRTNRRASLGQGVSGFGAVTMSHSDCCVGGARSVRMRG